MAGGIHTPYRRTDTNEVRAVSMQLRRIAADNQRIIDDGSYRTARGDRVEVASCAVLCRSAEQANLRAFQEAFGG